MQQVCGSYSCIRSLANEYTYRYYKNVPKSAPVCCVCTHGCAVDCHLLVLFQAVHAFLQIIFMTALGQPMTDLREA